MPEMETSTGALQEILFNSEKPDKLNIYAIVNGAGTDKVLMNLVAYEPEHRILYHEYEADNLEEAAPWLVKLKQGEPYTEWLLEECFGERLLLFIQSEHDIDSLASHFKDYTTIEFPDEQGGWQPGYFCFYDPSIFKAWITSLSEEEITAFHKLIHNFWFEDKNTKKLNRLSLKNDNSLVHSSITLSEETEVVNN